MTDTPVNPCRSNPLPCDTYGAATVETRDLIWGATNPYNPTWLQELADTVCTTPTCYAWRQPLKWDCTADPHAWVADGTPNTIEVDCEQDDFHYELTGPCAALAYGAVSSFADLPEESDVVIPPAGMADADDTICCPASTAECQWHVRFVWNGATCRWDQVGDATVDTHASSQAAGDFCSREESGTLHIDRYSEVLYAPAGQTCAEAFTMPPDGFLDLPTWAVYYLGCATAYRDSGLSVPAERKFVLFAVVPVGEGQSCPDFPMSAWGQTFDADNCPAELGFPGTGYDYYGCGLTMLAGGPFCSEADAATWETANGSQCPPVEPPTVEACQWVCTFVYNAGLCVWTLSETPHKVTGSTAMHAAGDYCADMTITRYGEIHEDGSCDPTSPEGFDTPPTAPVYYVVCVSVFSDEGCATLVQRYMMIHGQVPGETSDPCPQVLEANRYFDWPLTGDQCVYEETRDDYGRCALMSGPYCNSELAQEWINMNESECPAEGTPP